MAYQEQLGEETEKMLDDLNVVMAQLDRSSAQLSDVKRQVEITGKVIDLYWQLQSKSITMSDYRKQLMAVLHEW